MAYKITATSKETPCDCAVVGVQEIDPITGHIHYKNLRVQHCEFHASVTAAELARLQAIEALLDEARTVIGFAVGTWDGYQQTSTEFAATTQMQEWLEKYRKLERK